MYICKRCNYETKYKHCLIRHLQSQTPCKTSIQCTARDVLIAELQEKQYKESANGCTHCGRLFNNKSSLYRHKKQCIMLSGGSRF